MRGFVYGAMLGFALALGASVWWAWSRPAVIVTNLVRATVVVPGVDESATGPENIRAIQRALDIVQDWGGGTVQFPRGVFLVGGGSAVIRESARPINLNGPVTFQGDGSLAGSVFEFTR